MRGDDALTRRCRDGDWAKRLKGSFFGFKLHVKTDLDHGLVRAVEATRAGLSLYWCKMVLNPHSRLQSINGLYQGEVHEPAEGPT